MPACEHGAGLLAVERAALAEDVDPAGVRRARVEHLAARRARRSRPASYPGATTWAPRNVVSGVWASRDLQRAALVLDRQAVARLALDRRRAGATRLGDEPGDGGVQLARRRRRASPPRWCGCRRPCRGGRPCGRRTPRARSPANTRWPWESTKPGDDGAAGGVEALVAGRLRRLRARARPPHDAVAEHQRGVLGSTPSSGSLVTSSPMLSISSRVAASGALAGRRSRRGGPSATTWRPSTTTLAHVGGGGGEHDGLQRGVGLRAGQPHGVEADGHEVGAGARAAARPRRPSRAARGWPRRAAARRRRGGRASRVRRRSSSSTARASSNRSMTAWLSLPRHSRLGGRADPVGEVALRGRAHAHRGVAQQADVARR